MIQTIDNIEIVFYKKPESSSDEHIDFFDEEDNFNPFNRSRIVYKIDVYDRTMLQKTMLILMKHDLLSSCIALDEALSFKRFLMKREVEELEAYVESMLNKLSDEKTLDFSSLESLDMSLFGRQTGRSHIDKLLLSKTFFAKMTSAVDERRVSMMLQLPCPPDFKYILGTCIFAMKVR